MLNILLIVLILLVVAAVGLGLFWYLRQRSGVHPGPDSNLEHETDPTVLSGVQELLDQTYRDRPYKGQYTPKHLTARSVYRVVNEQAWSDYGTAKEELAGRRSSGCCHLPDEVITAENPNATNRLGGELDPSICEFRFFHGTQADSAHHIAATDFRLPESHEHGGMYGKGVYLAEASTKAHMYCKRRRKSFGREECAILIVRACLGEIHNTTELNPDGAALYNGAKSGNYDSVCGDRRQIKQNFGGYREFIVYDPRLVVAEFLVWCTESD